MRDWLKIATDDQLNTLFDVTLTSQHSKEQSELIRAIAEEYLLRQNIPPEEDVQDSYLHLMEKYNKVKENLPEGEDPVGLLLALFDFGTDEELQRLRDALSRYDQLPDDLQRALDGLNDKLSGRDAEAPWTKPKPRRGFIRSTLIAACFIAGLILTNSVVALATGFDFFGTLAKWSQDTVHFIWGEPDDSVEINTSVYRPLENVLNSLGIHVDLPRFALDRFELFSIEPEEPSAFSPITAWFIDGDEFYHIRVKRMGKTDTHSERNEDEQEEIYDGKFMILSNHHRMVAVWYQGIYEISIHGNLTREELTRILDSI